jgi:hypothetical protein
MGPIQNGGLVEPAPPLSRWLSGCGVEGCYVVHSLRISCSIFLEFRFIAILLQDAVSFVAISYPLSVEEDLEVL